MSRSKRYKRAIASPQNGIRLSLAPEASAQNVPLASSESSDFFEAVRKFEIALIERALEMTQGHQTRAARILGLRTTTLNTKIKVFGIQPQKDRQISA